MEPVNTLGKSKYFPVYKEVNPVNIQKIDFLWGTSFVRSFNERIFLIYNKYFSELNKEEYVSFKKQLKVRKDLNALNICSVFQMTDLEIISIAMKEFNDASPSIYGNNY